MSASIRECKPGGYFSNPGLLVWRHSNPGTRIPGFDIVGHLSVADKQIVYYKQLRGGQMEVCLARWLEQQQHNVDTRTQAKPLCPPQSPQYTKI